MSIVCDTLAKEQITEIEKTLRRHMNSDQFQEACLIINDYLHSNLNNDRLYIVKDTIIDNILMFKLNSKTENSIQEVILLDHNGLKNNFLSKNVPRQNLNPSEPSEWMRQNIINRILLSSISMINFEFGNDKNWIITNRGSLKNNYLGINESELDNLYEKILFSFNNIQVDIFANWFNNLYSNLNKTQKLSVLGGRFFLERPAYSFGGGNLTISSFKLKKDSFDNLLFFYNDHTIESGEFVREQFNLCSIPKTGGKQKFVRLYDSNEDTAYFNERNEDSLLLYEYSKSN